jgi:polysaccharide biosynthesis protein PslH
VNGPRLRLAFVSTQFLLPADAGGKIRSRNVLRGLKGGAFHITLICPADAGQLSAWAGELEQMADRVVSWPAQRQPPRWARAVDVLRELPVNVTLGVGSEAQRAVGEALAAAPFDVVVFDFVHAAVLMPPGLAQRSVCFTHNVEAEIFARHAQQAGSRLMKWLWASQAEKMRRFEAQALRRFDRVIAVSERDGRHFQRHYGVAAPQAIPTGVDLGFFTWQPPPAANAAHPPTAVFTGSMDWAANIDGVGFFLAEVWPRVLARAPAARFVVVGRNPPAALVARGQAAGGVQFTGYVDDVRPHVQAAQVFVIPLRVGGGTRIKAFEAMAMGCPMVSTALGVEGLEVVAGEHLSVADSAADQAAAILQLFASDALRQQLSRSARALVERSFGHERVARVFERICLDACAADARAA